MSTYTGKLEMSDILDRPLDIYLDLDDESLAMWTVDGEELGEWQLHDLQITGRDDGFTVKIEGFPAWVRTDDDGAFATEIGLRWAPPRLRRLMAAHTKPAQREAVLT